MQGKQVWGCRPELDGPDNWQSFTLTESFGAGATAAVFGVDGDYRPPLVAKLFNEAYRERVRKDTSIAHRLVHLALYRGYLEDHPLHRLPFAVWPRRILFDVREPNSAVQEQHMLGFTMAKLPPTTSLEALTGEHRTRTRLTAHNTLDIAITMANQLMQMHQHPWWFIFTDMSPKNIHISRDFAKVFFIDTDSFQFDNGTDFLPGGITSPYIAPGSHRLFHSRNRLTTTHVDFVLAIHIFTLLMADRGVEGAHPFTCVGPQEDHMIETRQYPYDNPTTYPIAPHALAAYASLPSEIRACFTRTFTGSVPIPVSEWPGILNRNRRDLCRRS